jgi:hypothetical protein
MEESPRAIFAGDLRIDGVKEMLDRWCQRASRSRLPSFIRLSKTIRTQKRRYPRLHQTWGIQREGRGTQHRSPLNDCQFPRLSLRQRYPRHGDTSLWIASSEATLGWNEFIRIGAKGAETATARMSFIVETLRSLSIPDTDPTSRHPIQTIESSQGPEVARQALVLVEINVEGGRTARHTPALSALLNQLGHQAYLESTV